MPSIFMSHNSKDKPFVRRLSNRLAKAGLVVWLDEAQLKIGDSILNKISKAISEVDFVAVVISKNSLESNWVKKEISLTLTKEITDSKPIALPVIIDNCDIPFELSDKLYADFRDPAEFDNQFAKLLEAMDIDKPIEDIKKGMTIDWIDGGPQISGHDVVLSSSESSALMDRYVELLPRFIDSEKERRNTEDVLDSAMFLSVLRACADTYNRVPDEEEMRRSESELSRKFNLFFGFIQEMQAEAVQHTGNGRKKDQ
jgi:hypothetical protein